MNISYDHSWSSSATFSWTPLFLMSRALDLLGTLRRKLQLRAEKDCNTFSSGSVYIVSSKGHCNEKKKKNQWREQIDQNFYSDPKREGMKAIHNRGGKAGFWGTGQYYIAVFSHTFVGCVGQFSRITIIIMSSSNNIILNNNNN